MKVWLGALGLFLCVAVVFAADDVAEDTDNEAVPDQGENGEIEKDNGVLVLTDSNIDAAIKAHPTLMIEFYAPWCGHCKALAPKYEEAAKSLEGSDPPAVLAKLDADKYKDVGSKYGVQGFPTLKLFKNGEIVDYEGGREAHDIVEFMKEKADPNWKPPPSKVIILTKENFPQFAEEQELALVEFFAPWCGHCKALAPKFEKAARRLADHDPPIALATVDATVETELATKYGVTGYPTLKIFRKGRVTDYTGGREEHDIVSHMMDQIGEGSKLLDSIKKVKAVMKEDDVTIGAFFENDQDPRYQPYLDAANDLRNSYTFFHSFTKEVREKYKLNSGSVVVFNAERFYTEYENKWHVLEQGSVTSEEIKKFIKDHEIPLVGELTSDNEHSRYKIKPLCIFFYSVDFGFQYRKATQMFRHRIAGIANKHKNTRFAVADDDGPVSEKLKEFELDDSNEDMKIGCYDKEGLRYKMEVDEWDTDDIEEFITKFEKGKLKPVIKSQKPPKQQGDVVTVVGKTFDSIVHTKDKDVLLEFYAPWCGHCKKLEPIYKQLAQKYKTKKNLVIAKIDGTANDAPKKYETSGFPTIFMIPAGSDTPIKHKGGREIEDLEKFIKEHAKVSFTKDEL